MNESEFHLKNTVALLRRQIRLILWTVLFGVSMALVYLVTVTPIYTATALLLVDPSRKNILDAGQIPVSQSSADNARVESEVEVLKSDSTALEVILKEGLTTDPEFGPAPGILARIRSALGSGPNTADSETNTVKTVLGKFKAATTIRRKGLTYLIAASVSAQDPDRAARLANTLADTYIEQQIAAKVAASLAARDILQAQINASRAFVAQADNALKLFVQNEAAILARENGPSEIAAPRQMDGLTGVVSPPAVGSADGAVHDRQTLLLGALSSQTQAAFYTLQQEAAIARSQYRNILSRLRETEAQAMLQVADSRVVSAALSPENPDRPNKKLVIAAALSLSLGLGIGLAFLKEFYVGGISSVHQLENVLPAVVASRIPQATLPAGQLSLADTIHTAPLSPFAESLRKLRATIDQSFRHSQVVDRDIENPQGRVILLTSSVPAEGKTTTALALARTYATAGNHTLLIDGDLRKPSLSIHLGLEPAAGFLEYLRRPGAGSTVSSFFVRDPASDVQVVLGAGRSDTATDQPLNSETFEILLEEARASFDIIIVDSPPLLPVVDARYIAHQADAVVLIVRYATTGQGDVRTAASHLRDAIRPGTPLFTALCHETGQRRDYRYDDYYTSGTAPRP